MPPPPGSLATGNVPCTELTVDLQCDMGVCLWMGKQEDTPPLFLRGGVAPVFFGGGPFSHGLQGSHRSLCTVEANTSSLALEEDMVCSTYEEPVVIGKL